jgi:hypothetical protein
MAVSFPSIRGTYAVLRPAVVRVIGIAVLFQGLCWATGYQDECYACIKGNRTAAIIVVAALIFFHAVIYDARRYLSQKGYRAISWPPPVDPEVQ